MVGCDDAQDERREPGEGCDEACEHLSGEAHGGVAQPDDAEGESGCADAQPYEQGDCGAGVLVHFVTLFLVW